MDKSNVIGKIENGTSVTLHNGASVQVRTLTRSDRDRLAVAAQYEEGKTYSEMLLQNLTVRFAVTGFEPGAAGNLVNSSTGDPVKFKQVTAGFGKIATEEFYNALTNEDIVKIVKAATDDGKVEDSEKKPS